MVGSLQDHDEVPFVEARKSDWLIEDVDGNTFADHVSAWGSTPLGATPPEVQRAVADAQLRYGMEITDYVPNEPQLALAERLIEVAPPGITRVAVGLTGTLAVETGVKLAREATGRPMILTFYGQYHGETTYLTASASTDLSEVTTANAQYVAGLVFAPYPNTFRAPFHRGPGPFDDTLYLDYIEDWVLVHQVEPEQIAGVLIEPVLGEGGILSPSQAFWDRLQAMCRRWGWKLILDEVQTCMGRCGTMFASERWDLRARHRAAGQGVRRRRAADRGRDGDRGGHGLIGHPRRRARSRGRRPRPPARWPRSTRSSRATCWRTCARSKRSRSTELGPLVERYEQVGDVRAAGALIGIEFVTDKATIAPAPAFHRAVHQAALRRGVLAITQWGKWVYRLQPALNMPPELFRWSCRAIADAIAEVAADPPAEPASILDREAPVEGGSRRR